MRAFTKITAFKFMSQVGQNSASESRPNFSFQILTKLLAQNIDQSLTTKSPPNISLNIVNNIQCQIKISRSEGCVYFQFIPTLGTVLTFFFQSGSYRKLHPKWLDSGKNNDQYLERYILKYTPNGCLKIQGPRYLRIDTFQ